MSDITVLNTDSDLSGRTLLTAQGAYTVTGLHTFTRNPSPPFGVSSASAKVDNLDSDMVDGYHAADIIALAGGVSTGGTNTWTGVNTFTQTAVFNNASAPFAVTSTNVVTNLNADLLDGFEGAAFARLAASTVTFTGNLQFGTSQVFSWAAKSVDTVYQAASDGFVVVAGTGSGGVAISTIKTDASNPPTTVRAGSVSANGDTQTSVCPVKKGDYYKVFSTGSTGSPVWNIEWVPLGTAG